MNGPFDSIYSHGMIRVAACVPEVRLGSPRENVDATISLAERAQDRGAILALFPELNISAWSLDDLLQQDVLLDEVRVGIARLKERSSSLDPVLVVGAPLVFDGRLYNCAVVLHRGSILGVVPKSYLPNYREFYEKRHFTPARVRTSDEVTLCGETVPFGPDVVFGCRTIPGFALHVEICEDLWAPIPPSSIAALAGATVLCNLSASNVTIGKADYRRDLCASQSGKSIAAYLYTAAGAGESTTDLAWDGHAMIYENDEKLAESERFPTEPVVLTADIDLERLRQDRMRLNSFNDSVQEYRSQIGGIRHVEFDCTPPSERVTLDRHIDRFPYVPNEPERRAERCFEAYNIQVQGLATRLKYTGIDKVVIGVSGGLDSTQALLVAAQTMDRLGLPRTNVLAYTLPGYATSKRTLENARRLMKSLGVTSNEIDIRPQCDQMLADIDHPHSDDEAVYDVTYENVQAGARTSILFRLANHNGALVVGTGDLSELALGWTTYGVGDQMSHYNVNTSVPKTLVQYLIRWVMESLELDRETVDVLKSILETEISPELVPGTPGNGNPEQRTESIIGPYELQDFNLYYVSRYGFRPSKIAYLAWNAWKDNSVGDWPAIGIEEKHNEYDLSTIKKWLRVFLGRFFGSSQFKRSASPNGPKVGSGGSLSPRGDWRAPSDSKPDLWLNELDENVPDSV